MARQSDSERNRKQRERQRQLRDQQRAERRPGRDDVARITLHWMITRSVATSNEDQLDVIEDVLVRRLVAQGYDERASYEVFDDLVDKYADTNFGFRRKVHLLFSPDLLSQDER
ncbi:hypothetical protein AB4Z52_12680 [Rhizobium sp. 2YAF20]|uniref:hypothetical protein n=1 Tax=Rhizobium sp. 2YAF20 TaxID=3233027 RepID=UPI003F9E7309